MYHRHFLFALSLRNSFFLFLEPRTVLLMLKEDRKDKEMYRLCVDDRFSFFLFFNNNNKRVSIYLLLFFFNICVINSKIHSVKFFLMFSYSNQEISFLQIECLMIHAV